MINDVSLGQYFPGQSVIHRMDPRIKLIMVMAYIVMLFMAFNFLSLLFTVVFFAFIIIISRVPFKTVLKSLKPIIPIIIFTSIIQIFYMGGQVVIKFWIIEITKEGIFYAVFIVIRICLLISGSSLLTYTTTPTALTDALERLLSPLKLLKVKVHELAMMMTLALRMVPTLIEETDKIMSAQKARGADIDTGGFLKRIRALIPILIPLFVSSFRRAYELAIAMECRCYKGGEGRTCMKMLKMSRLDLYAVLVFVLSLGGVIALNYAMPPVI